MRFIYSIAPSLFPIVVVYIGLDVGLCVDIFIFQVQLCQRHYYYW